MMEGLIWNKAIRDCQPLSPISLGAKKEGEYLFLVDHLVGPGIV